MLRKIYKKCKWKKKMKSIDKEVRSGRMSMNEARKKCGLPTVENGYEKITEALERSRKIELEEAMAEKKSRKKQES